MVMRVRLGGKVTGSSEVQGLGCLGLGEKSKTEMFPHPNCTAQAPSDVIVSKSRRLTWSVNITITISCIKHDRPLSEVDLWPEFLLFRD